SRGTPTAGPSCDGEVGLLPEVTALARARPHGAPAGDPLGDEAGPAPGARLGDRPLPQHELAVGIRRAPVEGPAPLRASLEQLARVAGRRAGDAQRDGLGGLAVGVARARDELAEAAVFDHHRLAARRADLVGGLVLGALTAADVAGVLAFGIGRARQELAE